MPGNYSVVTQDGSGWSQPSCTGMSGKVLSTDGSVLQWVDAQSGPTGPAGPKGDTGDTGATGPAGPTGPQGLTGATGATGPAGSTGATGATGAQGPQGTAGATGQTGATGPQGPSGPTNITALTGDVTASGSGSVSATIGTGRVTYAKIQNETNNTVLGNISGGSAAPSELTAANLKTLCGYYTSGDSPTFGTITLTALSTPLAEGQGGNGSATKPGHYSVIVSSAVATSCVGSSTTQIPFATVTTNVGSVWSSPTFTAPATGIYQVNFHLRITVVAATAVGLTAGIFVGGSLNKSFGPGVFTTTTSQVTVDITGGGLLSLSATNTVDIRVVNSNSTARSLNGTATDNFLTISGPF